MARWPQVTFFPVSAKTTAPSLHVCFWLRQFMPAVPPAKKEIASAGIFSQVTRFWQQKFSGITPHLVSSPFLHFYSL